MNQIFCNSVSITYFQIIRKIKINTMRKGLLFMFMCMVAGVSAMLGGQLTLPEMQEKCDSAYEAGDYDMVLELCPQIRAEHDLPYLWSYEALSNAELGHMNEAVENVVVLIDMTGLNADAYDALTGVGDKDLALLSRRLRNQEQSDSENPIWPESLGVIYSYYNLYNEAVDCYLRALSLNPSNDGDAEALAMLYNQMRQYKEALKYAELSLSINPYDYGHMETRALILRNSGDAEGAEAYLSQLIDIEPDYAPFYTWRGMLRNADGRYVDAANDFSTSLTIDSVGSEAKLRLAIAKYNLGEKVMADSLFRQVIDKSSPLWGGNAIAAAYIGDKKAVDAYKEMILHNRRLVNNYLTLAALADISNDKEGAMMYLRKALSENVLNPDIIQYDPNLRNVKHLQAYRDLCGESM